MSLLQLPLDIKESRINEKHTQHQKHNYSNYRPTKNHGQHQQQKKVIKTLDGEKMGSFLPEAELGSFWGLQRNQLIFLQGVLLLCGYITPPHNLHR